MTVDKKQGIRVIVDSIKCHEDYLKRTSKYPKRDIYAFRRYLRFCNSLRKVPHQGK